MPTVYMDLVTDMRPAVQRQGRGHFLGIDYPNDAAWEKPVTELYAEALAQDVEQTSLVQLVPLRGPGRLRDVGGYPVPGLPLRAHLHLLPGALPGGRRGGVSPWVRT